jgi:hypothetical protein
MGSNPLFGFGRRPGFTGREDKTQSRFHWPRYLYQISRRLLFSASKGGFYRSPGLRRPGFRRFDGYGGMVDTLDLEFNKIWVQIPLSINGSKIKIKLGKKEYSKYNTS